MKNIYKSYCFDEKTVNDLSKELNISKNTIISLLNTYYKEEVKREELPSFKTDAKSLLVIADTHIGSKYDNLNYIDEAYNTGLKVGVDACLHLGDIIQANMSYSDKSIEYQLDAFVNKYPEPDEFVTHVLLGNHDYKLFENDSNAKGILEAKKQMLIYGYKRAYFDWCNYMFAMEHKIKYISEDMPFDDIALNFTGHGHELKLKSEARLKAPTCSDDIMNKNNGAYPGFMIANMDNDEVIIDVYDYKDNKARVRKKEFYVRNLIDSYKVK